MPSTSSTATASPVGTGCNGSALGSNKHPRPPQRPTGATTRCRPDKVRVSRNGTHERHPCSCSSVTSGQGHSHSAARLPSAKSMRTMRRAFGASRAIGYAMTVGSASGGEVDRPHEAEVLRGDLKAEPVADSLGDQLEDRRCQLLEKQRSTWPQPNRARVRPISRLLLRVSPRDRTRRCRRTSSTPGVIRRGRGPAPRPPRRR